MNKWIDSTVTKPHICFFGLMNLPVLAPEFEAHGIGGEQVQHTLLGKALVHRGYRVSMVVGDYLQPDGAAWSGIHTYKAFKPDEGIPVLRFIYPRWTKIWAALRRANADIYYASSAGMHVGLIALFCQKYSRKLVYRVAHDNDCSPDRVKLLVRYSRDRYLYSLGLKNADAILVQSRQQQRDLQEHYSARSDIASMLITEPVSGPRPGHLRDIDILWVNNLREFKRPDRVIELAKALPHLNFHMIGGEEEGHGNVYRDISNLAAGLPNLTFHGRVPYSRVHEFYERAKVFVNTSDSEGFPNSFLQAWVRATPVVSFFDPDGVIIKNGLGIVPTSMQDMAQALAMMTSDEKQRQAYALRCQSHMHLHYNNEMTVAPYCATFDRLASGHPNAAAA